MPLSLIVGLLLGQTPPALPAFAAWDGKAWAGISVGASEGDLRKSVRTAKTAIADIASIRLQIGPKDQIVSAILTEPKRKGSVAGFAIEGAKDEPLCSLAQLQDELGVADSEAFPETHFANWSIVLWKRGVAAVIRREGETSKVYKVLLAPSDRMLPGADKWPKKATDVQATPSVPIEGFDVSAGGPGGGEAAATVSGIASRAMRNYRTSGWSRSRKGVRAGVHIDIQKSRKTFVVGCTVDVSYKDALGDVSPSEHSTTTVDDERQVGGAAGALFESLLRSLSSDIEKTYRRLIWQAEWRPFYALARG